MLIPKLLPIPFAENGRKNTIPDNRTSEMQAHLASFDTGFPPITMQPKQDGGLPPDGMDMNGILYDLSAHAVYQNKGGQYKFNTEYAELIGGYPKGAILLSDDETKQYISVSENNKDNFNTSTSVNWKVISLADIDVLLNDKVSSQTMADALNLKLDKTTYATLIQKGITQLTNTIDDSEDKAATPKAVNTVKKKADQLPNPEENLFPVGQSSTAYRLVDAEEMKTILGVPVAVNVVQTTGTSTTSVMSQKAVADLVTSSNNYQKINKSVLQRGTAISNESQILFPVAFSNDNVSIATAFLHSNNSNADAVHIYNVTKHGFYAKGRFPAGNGSNLKASFSYIAMGE